MRDQKADNINDNNFNNIVNLHQMMVLMKNMLI